jgi:hypothetical protein
MNQNTVRGLVNQNTVIHVTGHQQSELKWISMSQSNKTSVNS